MKKNERKKGGNSRREEGGGGAGGEAVLPPLTPSALRFVVLRPARRAESRLDLAHMTSHPQPRRRRARRREVHQHVPATHARASGLASVCPGAAIACILARSHETPILRECARVRAGVCARARRAHHKQKPASSRGSRLQTRERARSRPEVGSEGRPERRGPVMQATAARWGPGPYLGAHEKLPPSFSHRKGLVGWVGGLEGGEGGEYRVIESECSESEPVVLRLQGSRSQGAPVNSRRERRDGGAGVVAGRDPRPRQARRPSRNRRFSAAANGAGATQRSSAAARAGCDL